ncbi:MULTISPECIES: hypothetical protein [unclassified Variovorax]|uniref:hypothetical protein n=1 Tax=unclassified Variovorax TaxID=663243 RepID=UPI003ED0664B
MPTNLSEFLGAIAAGKTAYSLDTDDPGSQAKLNEIAELAFRAERQGYTIGTVVTPSKGRDTRGLPWTVKAGHLTPLGNDWLKAADRR